MMILEDGGEPQYINWWNCPKYRTVKLSRLLDEKDTLIKSKMYLRVTLDLPISYEEANFIKETFMKDYECREISLIPNTQDEEMNSDIDITKFESVDEIVAKEIEAIESDSFDKSKLLSIYRDLSKDD